jgi:hypothetical protein
MTGRYLEKKRAETALAALRGRFCPVDSIGMKVTKNRDILKSQYFRFPETFVALPLLVQSTT